MRKLNERVHFRFFVMPCCHHQLCWVNPRNPTYCPECGAPMRHGFLKDAVRVSDSNATLHYDGNAQP